MIFDTHAHYDDSRFDPDREELLAGMAKVGVVNIVNATSDYKSLSASLELCEKYDYFYTTMGLHPSDVKGLSLDVLSEIRKKAGYKKCVAIGEIGLDYYWEKDEGERTHQRDWFRAQLNLAKELDLPAVIHSREACEDTVLILKEAAKEGIVCDIHCFSYSPEVALEFVKMGFYIGVGGVVTFSNSKKLRQTVEAIPLSRILLETDCPYLAPSPFRGERNDSQMLYYVVQEIARLKGTTEYEVLEETEKNARKFYRL